MLQNCHILIQTQNSANLKVLHKLDNYKKRQTYALIHWVDKFKLNGVVLCDSCFFYTFRQCLVTNNKNIILWCFHNIFLNFSRVLKNFFTSKYTVKSTSGIWNDTRAKKSWPIASIRFQLFC